MPVCSANITAKPQFGKFDPKAELRNINYQGKRYIADRERRAAGIGVLTRIARITQIDVIRAIRVIRGQIEMKLLKLCQPLRFLGSICLFAAATSPTLLQIADRYWMQPDVVYGSANNTPLKLDIWYPRDNPNPTPTLVYIHGGGWIFGSKEGCGLSAAAISRTRMACRQRRIPDGGKFACTGLGRRYAVRSSLDIPQCGAVQIRYIKDRLDRTFRGRASFADNRNAAGRYRRSTTVATPTRNTATCR